jgi:signal transduction histidine kinase
MRKRLSISKLLQAVTGLMAIALVASFAIVAGDAFMRLRTAERVLATADISRDLFMALQDLMVERGTVNTALVAPKLVDSVTKDTIAALRAHSEQALNSALGKLADAQLDGTSAALAEISANHDRINELRQKADEAVLQPFDQRPIALGPKWIAEGGKLVDSIATLSEVLSSNIVQTDPFIAEMMKMKQLAWATRDAVGLDRLLIGAAIAKQSFPAEMRQQTVELMGRADAAWKIIDNDVRLQIVPAALRDAVVTADRVYFGDVRARRKQIIEALTAGKLPGQAGVDWIAIPNRDLEPVINVANTAFDLTMQHAAAEANAARRYFILATLLMLFFVGFGVFAMGLVIRRVARPMATITAAVRSVAAGDLSGAIPFEQRNDELGDLARALAVFRDNAVAKQRMEGELIRKERLSAVGQLTATVAHELRNPLSAIRNCAYVLREMVGGTGALERPVARIERSVARCDNIIADLLNFTRMRELQRASIVADDWLGEVLGEQKLPEGIVLSRLLAAPGRRIDFDADRMRQVVINLVENAAQALIEQADKAGERRITVATRATDEFFEIAITDTGPGMTGEVLAKVFDPLFSTKAAGTGLGLPTVKQIVEQHGGTITLTSDVGKGTVALIRLPHHAAAEIAA